MSLRVFLSCLALLVLAAPLASAAPLDAELPDVVAPREPMTPAELGSLELTRRQSVTTLSSTQVSTYNPYAYYAGAAYCAPRSTKAWSCGASCSGNRGFVPTASGGDGEFMQFWYVGYDSARNTVVVAHQGTDPTSLIAALTDINILLMPLDSMLFPGLPSSIRVHNGFAEAHERAASAVLSATRSTLAAHPSASVTLVGHSLGAALALLDAIFLPLHLPAGTQFKFVGFGMPRVGNPAFADYVDAHVRDLTRINNRDDPVPIIPGRFLGFRHPSGEVHIDDSGAWRRCTGQENESEQCTAGSVDTIFESNVFDHDGPYNGIEVEC